MAEGATASRRRRPSHVVADMFARRVASLSDENLERGMRSYQRRPVLSQIFRQMPRSLDRRRSKGVSAVIDFRIGGARGGGEDRYQVVIENSRCHATRRCRREPTLTLRMDGVNFLKLIAGVASGPELFMTGKVLIDGDLMLAARLPALFRIPSAGT